MELGNNLVNNNMIMKKQIQIILLITLTSEF